MKTNAKQLAHRRPLRFRVRRVQAAKATRAIRDTPTCRTSLASAALGAVVAAHASAPSRGTDRPNCCGERGTSSPELPDELPDGRTDRLPRFAANPGKTRQVDETDVTKIGAPCAQRRGCPISINRTRAAGRKTPLSAVSLISPDPGDSELRAPSLRPPTEPDL